MVKNRKSYHHRWIVHIQISLGTKFQLKLTILIFWTKFAPKMVFSVENGKSEQHHQILHIRINIDTKFQLKLSILIFWTKFFQKGFFWWKTKKVNITIEFFIFELVWTPNWMSRLGIFWAKFAQGGCFWSKTEYSHLFICPWTFLTILNFFGRGPTDTVNSWFSFWEKK